MPVRFFSLVFVFYIAAAAAGCGSKNELPQTAPTSGSVTYKGKAVAGLRVTLHPQAAAGLPYAPVGETNKDGKFVVSTGSNTGAAPGEYVVTIDWPKIESDRKSGIEVEVDQLKGKYSDPTKSQWRVEIKSGDNTLGPYQLD